MTPGGSSQKATAPVGGHREDGTGDDQRLGTPSIREGICSRRLRIEYSNPEQLIRLWTRIAVPAPSTDIVQQLEIMGRVAGCCL